ncbi:MAG: sigma-70 family RNA polymerase sigma factor [Ilumatobacteraceae bacterium]
MVPDRQVAEMSDTELLGVLSSDDQAFRELIRRHQRSMRRLARSMLRNTGDADEAVQDSLLAAYRHARSFRGDASVRSWLHAICYRQCLTRLRRARLDLVPLDSAMSLSGPESGPLLPFYLEAAVAGLPVDNQAAFVLVDVLGFTREDAATIVGVPANTMRARVARARLLLADAVADVAEVHP